MAKKSIFLELVIQVTKGYDPKNYKCKTKIEQHTCTRKKSYQKKAATKRSISIPVLHSTWHSITPSH
jgi:hypothetical protein